MHFPLGLPDEYYKGLTAERLVSRYHRGFLTRVWEKDAAERNEPLDLEVYAYAAAIYAGVTRVNWDRLEAALRATAGDLFVDAENKKSRRARQ
jgi:phage terminase large subunit GpA-like protein